METKTARYVNCRQNPYLPDFLPVAVNLFFIFRLFVFCFSHLMLKSVFFFFNFQMWSLRIVVVLLCSSLNDDLCRLILVLNSFSVSPMYVSCFFVSVSVTVAL